MNRWPIKFMNPLIFLSYSSKNKLIADAICSRLENQAIRCWIAPRDVKPGTDYSNQIADALESSNIMVMVFSSDSNSSRHVKSEIDRAFSLGKIIIPFRVENVELDKGLSYYLAKTHWLDAVTGPLEQHIDKLAVTIGQISGTDAPNISQRPPPPPPVVAPVPQTSASKTPWLIAGIAVFCALLGSAALLVMWMRKSETVRTSQAPAVSTPSVAIASPSASAAKTTKKTIVSAPPTVPPEQNVFEGTWTIAEADTLNGNPYTGTVRITKNGVRYEVAWKSTASNAKGIALANGNKLCVAWGAGNFGVVLYKIGSDGTLRGKWTGSANDGDKSDGLENAIGGSTGALAGAYVVKGSNPGGGGTYEGKLKIAKTGETYQLEWTVADRLTKGIGIKVDDSLFVAWGEKEPFGVVSYNFEGSQAKGVWALGGASQTAIENLTK